MIYNSSITYSFDGDLTAKCPLDPEKFLYCDDEEQLNEVLRDYIDNNSEGNWGDVDCNEVFDRFYEVPNEFYADWRRLKQENS